MKTNTASTPINASSSFTRMHWFISIVGVVIAIVCSFVLLSDMKDRDQRVDTTASISSIINMIPSVKIVPTVSINSFLK